jgi:hypothetical protein
MTSPIPVEERRARELLHALRLMGPNGEGFDVLLRRLREDGRPATIE